MRLAILAHDHFPERAKTALGVLRYGDQEVVAIVDRGRAGSRIDAVLEGMGSQPIVDSVATLEPDAADALLVGVAPIGGRLPEDWRPDILTALDRGWDVIAGLHDFLGEQAEFAERAATTGATIHDVRKPPRDSDVSEGRAGSVDATVVCTVGTDCSVGKMTTSMELVRSAKERGIDATVVPTGQTGVIVTGWGTVVDSVPSDFVAGVVEDLVCEAAADHDLLVVEGQGSVVHPAYSGVSLGILHGAMPDRLVLCHEAGRHRIHGYEHVALPATAAIAGLYEALAAPVAPAPVVAGALNTAALEPEAAQRVIERLATALEVPVADPVRQDPVTILEAIV